MMNRFTWWWQNRLHKFNTRQVDQVLS